MDTTRSPGAHGPGPANGAELFWEEHHRTRASVGVEQANPLLVEIAHRLPPGAALDLGCGAGGDTIWLARHRWQVTAVDISATAVARVRAVARECGVAGQVRAERHDVNSTFPTGDFDLVSAQYFHAAVTTPRSQVLAAAARALRPGGLLAVVDHGSIAPWSWNQDPGTRFPSPAEVAAGLQLDPAEWSIVRADMPQRHAIGPDGQTATVTDNVLVLRRATG